MLSAITHFPKTISNEAVNLSRTFFFQGRIVELLSSFVKLAKDHSKMVKNALSIVTLSKSVWIISIASDAISFLKNVKKIQKRVRFNGCLYRQRKLELCSKELLSLKERMEEEEKIDLPREERPLRETIQKSINAEHAAIFRKSEFPWIKNYFPDNKSEGEIKTEIAIEGAYILSPPPKFKYQNMSEKSMDEKRAEKDLISLFNFENPECISAHLNFLTEEERCLSQPGWYRKTDQSTLRKVRQRIKFLKEYQELPSSEKKELKDLFPLDDVSFEILSLRYNQEFIEAIHLNVTSDIYLKKAIITVNVHRHFVLKNKVEIKRVKNYITGLYYRYNVIKEKKKKISIYYSCHLVKSIKTITGIALTVILCFNPPSLLLYILSIPSLGMVGIDLYYKRKKKLFSHSNIPLLLHLEEFKRYIPSELRDRN